jgi:transposase-like protein
MLLYHPTAKTTYNIRKEINENPKGLSQAQLAKKYNVSQRTILKWRHREDFNDAPHGPINPNKSISDLEEHIICEIRKTTLLPLDDLLDVIKKLGINITRSALHRALQRNGLSNMKKYLSSLTKEDKPKHSTFKEYKAGYIHIDIKYLPKVDGKRQYLYVAIDRSTRLVFVDIYSDKTAKSANSFLNSVIDYFPFEIYKILTDNGKEFTDRFSNRTKKPTGNHIFDKTCSSNNIEHRLTVPYTPKTNGMVERVNGKVTANVLDKIVFTGVEHMKETIFHYFYNYNYHIKHSGLGRITPIDALEENYNKKEENGVKFKVNLDIFHLRNRGLLDNYNVGHDKLDFSPNTTDRFSCSNLSFSLL